MPNKRTDWNELANVGNPTRSNPVNDLIVAINLPETTSFTFPFEQTQNISFSDWSLDVSDNGSSCGTATLGIHEFDSDLGHITGVSGSSQDAANLCEFDWGILNGKRGSKRCMLVKFFQISAGGF